MTRTHMVGWTALTHIDYRTGTSAYAAVTYGTSGRLILDGNYQQNQCHDEQNNCCNCKPFCHGQLFVFVIDVRRQSFTAGRHTVDFAYFAVQFIKDGTYAGIIISNGKIRFQVLPKNIVEISGS